MKKVAVILLVLSFIVVSAPNVFAGYVNGYYRSNGTYVNGYYRTEADGSPYNNYSYPGNYNPNTGKITGGDPLNYLNNYYKSSGSSGYSSYPTISSCPLNSYSSGVSTCKCNSGYVSNGSSCVSADSVCNSQLGYSSRYNSLNNTCECNYGYVIGKSGRCESGTSVCMSQIGLMSQYNSLSKKCECMVGYQFDGSSCVYKSNYSASSYSCPLNSHESISDDDKCECDVGFQINAAKNGCTPIIEKTNDQVCVGSFGINSMWNGTKTAAGLLNCICKVGHQWNATKTSCN